MTADNDSHELDAAHTLDEGIAAGLTPMQALTRLLTASGLKEVGEGDLIGQYRVLRMLGRGGMGTTYAAVAPDGHRVAIKIVDGLGDTSRERFLNEGRLLSRLRHDSIVGYRDFVAPDNGRAYMVMDLVDGPNLEQVLEDAVRATPSLGVTLGLLEGIDVRGEAVLRHPSWQRRMVKIALELAGALHASHSLGIIHRDVKPANVLVRADFSIVLIDFGLSRDLFRMISLSGSETVGTLSYMAPEQFARDPGEVDARTDIFALGLLLYRALTGRLLRERAQDILEFHRRPLLLDRRICSSLLPAVVAVLYGCLEPRKQSRYATALEVEFDLREALGSGHVKRPAPGWIGRAWRLRFARVAAVIVASLTLVVASWLLLRTPHVITISAINYPGSVRIDGEPFGQAPVRDAPIEGGSHVIEYSSPYALPLRESFVVTRPRERLNLLTVSTNPTTAPVPDLVLHDGADRVLLHWRPVSATQTRSLTGRLLAPSVEWLWVAPGRYGFEVLDAETGLREFQELTLRSAHLEEVRLLTSLKDWPAGSFQFSLAAALSPRPDHVSLTLGDGAICFMNEARDPVPVMTDTRLAGRGIQFSSYIAPDRAYVDVEACITVRFPERMRSVSFRAICFDSEAGSVSLSYRCDDAGWRSCDQKDNANIIVVDVPDDGVSAIDVRGIMRVSQTASAMTYAGFLGGVMASDSTLYPDTDAAAFRLVADPDPRLPTTPIK